MSGYVPVKLQRQIRKQFCDRCAYCQTSEALMAITFEFEHIATPTPMRYRLKSKTFAQKDS